MRILQINVNVNSGSTGRIAEEIGKAILANGHESYIAYGRGVANSKSNLIKIGNKLDNYLHGIYTLLTDKHGFASTIATRRLIKQINRINPDILVLQNLHGYYINIAVLFEYLAKINKPVVWIFHDCWPFTGHCSHFENVGCFKWQAKCYECPKKNYYPKSWVDNSEINFIRKRALFTALNNLQIVVPSNWLKRYVQQSFFNEHPVTSIPNGVDVAVFKPIVQQSIKPYLLFVSNVWVHTKGYADIIKLRTLVSNEIEFIIVGVSKQQQQSLPTGIKGILRTGNTADLVRLYSNAICLVNPTYSDNFPTVNIEALACGTPVVTYDTGGSPEAIDAFTGIVVDKGNISGLSDAVHQILKQNREILRTACRNRAEKLFDKNKTSNDYMKLFENLLSSHS